MAFQKMPFSHLDMVGVDGSSPFAPTKIGREIKHLAETLSAFFLPKPNRLKTQKSSLDADALLEVVTPGHAQRVLRADGNRNLGVEPHQLRRTDQSDQLVQTIGSL